MRSQRAADPISWACKSFPPAALRYERLHWDNAELAGSAGYSRIDPILDTVWEGSPAPGISAVFSARWRGYRLPLADESHELTLESDDGSRSWLGENLLIDQWQGAPNKGSATVDLRADTPVELRYTACLPKRRSCANQYTTSFTLNDWGQTLRGEIPAALYSAIICWAYISCV